MKAQQRISEKNDILGMNKFAIFHTVNDECLATIALDSGINFGDSMHVVKSNIKTLKAREAAQSLICIAKDRLDKEKWRIDFHYQLRLRDVCHPMMPGAKSCVQSGVMIPYYHLSHDECSFLEYKCFGKP